MRGLTGVIGGLSIALTLDAGRALAVRPRGPAAGVATTGTADNRPTATPHEAPGQTLAAASGPPAAEPRNALGGDELLLRMLSQLQAHTSITASLYQQASIDGYQLEGGGQYLQRWNRVGDKLLVRMQLQAQLGNTTVSLLQISNGNRLWSDRRTPLGRRVTVVKLTRLRAELDARGVPAEGVVPPGRAEWLPVQAERASWQGGLPMLVAGLYQNFSFSPPISMLLSDVEVYSTVGVWKREALAELWPETVSALTAASSPQTDHPEQLPPHVPGSVLLLVGKDDLFPYVVEYRRPDPEPAAVAPTPPADAQRMSAHPLLLLRFYEVSFDVAIHDGQFDFAPGDADPVDLTAEHLRRIRKK